MISNPHLMLQIISVLAACVSWLKFRDISLVLVLK